MIPGSAESSIDRYVVLEYLAEGGMGAIYLGKKLGAGGFEKEVVLKQLLPEFTQQPEFIDLFLREARLSATLDHANIVHTIDLVTAGDEHFIVMEYLDGADLRTLLKRAKRRNHPIGAAAAIFIAREMLSALAYAHNKLGDDGLPLRLIHRDISPSNILISGNGEVKLTDFGIAKASTHNSVFYRVKGKVGYMSPEQARSENLDSRSDLYSLAVCLYEILTGERLFVDAGLTVSAEEMYSQPIPLISRKVRGLPPDLDKVMLRALATDPNIRFQSAGEMQEALIRCAHRHGLMMSAPELADHLHEVCGDSRRWRDGGGRPESGSGPRGTEIVEGTEAIVAGTEAMLLDEESDVIQLSEASDLLPRRRSKRREALTHLTELKGIELTSVLHMEVGEHEGAEPLVDLDLESERLVSSSGVESAEETIERPKRRSSAGLRNPLGAPTHLPKSSPGPRQMTPAQAAFGQYPTGPRHAPVTGPPSSPAPSRRMDPLVSHSGLPRGETVHGPDPGRKINAPTAPTSSSSQGANWLVIVLLVVLAAGAAIGIGFTGPTLDVDSAATLPAE